METLKGATLWTSYFLQNFADSVAKILRSSYQSTSQQRTKREGGEKSAKILRYYSPCLISRKIQKRISGLSGIDRGGIISS